MEQTEARRKRSRIFVVSFVLLMVALSILATILIQSGRKDAKFQQDLQELREEGR